MSTSSLSLIPVGNKVIGLPMPHEEEVVGRIIIPGTVNADLLRAKLVAVSTDIPHQYKVDDIVIFPKGSGMGHMIAGVSYLFLQHTEIWAIEKPEANAENLN